MPQKKESLLADILSFYIRPTYIEELSKKPFHKKIFDVLRVMAFNTIILIPVFILTTLIISAFNYKPGDHAVLDFVTTSSPLAILLTGVILGPLLEELTFRLGLRFTKLNISISLSLLILTFLEVLNVNFYNLIPSSFINLGRFQNLIIFLFFALLIALLIFVILTVFKVKFEFLKKNFRWIFYLSVLSFGLLHITNFSNLGNMVFLFPVLIAPQIVAAFALGFLRSKYGIFWSYLGHMIHNFSLTVYFIILSLGSDKLKGLLQGGGKAGGALSLNLSNTDSMLITIVGFVFIFQVIIVLLLLLHLIIEWVFVRQENLAKNR